MKRCPQCGEEKRDSRFRYIKYFDARRRICKRCESQQLQQNRREVAQHVRETGFTPGILDRLRAQATRHAARQAREAVLSNLSPRQLKTFCAAELVERFLCVVLFLSFPAAYLVSLLIIVGKPIQWLVAPLCLGAGAGLAWLLVRRLWTRHISHEIQQRSAELYSEVFEQEAEARVENERFYASPEWRTLRDDFIRTHRKTNGCYVCHYCGADVSGGDLTVDHIKPRSRFPELALSRTNLRIACRACNSAKGTSLLGEPK